MAYQMCNLEEAASDWMVLTASEWLENQSKLLQMMGEIQERMQVLPEPKAKSTVTEA